MLVRHLVVSIPEPFQTQQHPLLRLQHFALRQHWHCRDQIQANHFAQTYALKLRAKGTLTKKYL